MKVTCSAVVTFNGKPTPKNIMDAIIESGLPENAVMQSFEEKLVTIDIDWDGYAYNYKDVTEMHFEWSETR